MQSPKSKLPKILLLVTSYCLLVTIFSGCATAPVKGPRLPTYTINNTAYVSLVSLCESNSIQWEYDIFTRTVTLNKGTHRIEAMIGDTLVLVDGEPRRLKHPVDMHQGMVVVPYGFKEEVLDDILREHRASPERRGTPLAKRIKKVVIDAGHGGKDPGAIGKSGLKEKHVTLDVSKRIASSLKSHGIDVVMTRSSDTFVSLPGRSRIANNSGADLFLSIHANANRVRGLNGFEVYYVSTSVDDSSRALSAARQAQPDLDNCYFGDSSLNLKAILWDMLYTHSRAESIELAESICRAVKGNLEIKILGVKDARFYVLKGTNIPAILVEIGFLSNYKEESKLKNNYYRQKMAESIVQGIQEYDRSLALAEAGYR